MRRSKGRRNLASSERSPGHHSRFFERQGFEISRATQSVWCGDVADLAEPLYGLMAARVRASHVVATDDTIMPMLSKGKTANARMWVYVGDEAIHTTSSTSRSTVAATGRSTF